MLLCFDFIMLTFILFCLVGFPLHSILPDVRDKAVDE